MRWMKLEPLIQSEGRQKETHQYSTLTHIYGIEKEGNDNPVCETAKEAQVYRTVFKFNFYYQHFQCCIIILILNKRLDYT